MCVYHVGSAHEASCGCCGGRYFPLRRSDTVAWAEEAPSPLAQLLRGVADAFRALPLPPALLAAGLRQVAAVQARIDPAARADFALPVVNLGL